MKILLLSAYDAQSHHYWRTSLEANFPEHQWKQLALPARYFAWRVRGNSLSWAYTERETLEQDWDLLIVTSMTDLSALRGMVPKLAKIPTLVYFHENQFDYPDSGKEVSKVEPQILSIYTALCADNIAFNSEYNRVTFLAGCRKLLKKLPDHVPPNLADLIAAKSQVLPVPVFGPLVSENFGFEELPAIRTKLQIVWNHRWEYDKGPDLLYLALVQLRRAGVNFVIHIVGQKFRQVPEAFNLIQNEFSENLGQFGYLETKQAYQELLEQSDIVLSTALHDFQGLAVLEAIQAGCVPLVPKRLAYPEYVAEKYCYRTGDQEFEAKQITKAIVKYSALKEEGMLPGAPDISHLSWHHLKPAYDALLKY